MTLANDSILVTPGSGATVATHTVNGKEHQVMMLAGARGHVWGSAPVYLVDSQNSANVAAARTTHIDLFNASGSGYVIEVLGVYIIPTLTAVAGIGLTWELIRTSSVGTGGTARTPVRLDTNNLAVPAQVTARSKPTGGASSGDTILYINTSSEETNPYAAMANNLNHLNFASSPDTQTLTLNEGEGIKIDQTTNSSIGSTNIRIVYAMK